MKQYTKLITEILSEGRIKTDRTGTGTISIFGHQSVYYMKDGFPLLTVKKTYPRGVFEELLWFLKGDTNIKYLTDRKVNIWNEWADKNGDLGPVYGKQWVDLGGYNKRVLTRKDTGGGRTIDQYVDKHIKGINQIQNVIDTLKNNPDSRRIIVDAWNVKELSDMALTPCHALFQFITEPLTKDERIEILQEKMNKVTIVTNLEKAFEEMEIPEFRLSLQLYQRSADTFLGVPFNIASYALLLHMVSQVVNMVPYKFVHTMGDAHLYLNHKDQVNEYLNRTFLDHVEVEEDERFDYWHALNQTDSVNINLNGTHPKLPTIKLNPEIKDIFDFKIEDIELNNYNPLPPIKAPVAV